MAYHIYVCLLLLPVGFFSSAVSRSKYIEIALDGKWKSTPLFLEASEFMAKESNDLFWSFVNPLITVNLRNPEYTAELSQYEVIMEMAESLLSKHQLSLFKFALSLRMHSPTVEMYNQVALDRRAHCEVFVEVNNLITCEKFALKAFIALAANQTKPMLLQNDHYYPGSSGRDVVVILYAQIGTPQFTEWHNMLVGLAETGQITYILRHFILDSVNTRSKIRLSGYGVELAIKSTEYKAKDDTVITGDKSKEGAQQAEDEVQGFMFTTLKELYPDMQKNLGDFRQHLVDSMADMAPLKVWQLQDLSFQAAQLILSASQINALRLFRDLSQNFPSRARSLIKVVVSDSVRREIKSNQKMLESTYGIMPGESAFFINGRQADLDIYDVFTLVETLRSEAKQMEGLYQLGKQYSVDDSTMLQLLKLDLRDAETMYAVDIRDPSVIYINDLERDRKYVSWPSSVQDLLRPTFPGMLRHIRKNLFHMVLFVNPADKFCGDLLKLAEAFYVHNAPVRIGLVFVVDNSETVDASNDVGVALLRAFNFIMKRDGAVKALSFLTDVYERAGPQQSLSVDVARKEFIIDHTAAEAELIFSKSSNFDGQRRIYNKELTLADVTNSLKKKFGDSFADVILNPDDWTFRQESAAYYERTGLGELPQVLMNGIPMKREDLRGEFEETIVQTILRQTGELQKAVFNGFLQDSMDVLDYLMTRSNVMPRLNSRVLSPPEKYLDFSWDMTATLVSNSGVFRTLSPAKMSGAVAASLKYLTKRDEQSMRAITHWVVVDLNRPDGRALLAAALKQLRHTSSVRVGIIHNFDVDDANTESKDYLLARLIELSVETLDTSTMKNFITKLLKEDNVEALLAGTKTLDDLSVSNMDMTQFNSQLRSLSNEKFKSHRKLCETVLNFKTGERGVISNGRVIGPLKTGELFIEEDFGLLEKYLISASTGKIEKKIKTLALDADRTSDFIMKVESLLVSSPQKEPRRDITFDVHENSVLTIPPRSEGPAYEVVAILDPTTRAAQKYVPFIMVLQDVVNVHINIFFNCREKLSEMPLKSYYRFVLEPELKFSKDSMSVVGPLAIFDDLPLKPLLTLGMDPPESWLVESVEAVYDLDNICMEEVENAVVARFELEYLLLEGHCYDSMTGNPPRGLQFVLGTNSTPAVVDTIVMANLGYFQLKANPGAWKLQLRQGRSSELYDIVGQDFTDSSADSTEVIAVLDSFKSKIIRIRVNKKSGKEHEDLLAEDESGGGGIWDSLSRFTGASKETEEAGETTLNIFSLASGHLYERFLRIMMLSVIENTKAKVKFWFLKNYLSPSFKDFIPHMANEYGFEYELVQYKWPRWLHQQTEKQRIIWGYKILFLDVLFPLNINKIIFVDADQTVRADLMELHDLDLEGAPYGYTPFCDSRRDMDGYRFWKTGYWSNHLGHRKYHISALYVVDLKKFRRIAAGDRLRGQYQGLSQDPNSLSNLDQDLPNNMIHQVAIKSLPQEWLWCETWCSDAEKERAKTIDLCNNPKTKEPKLTAAMRIIPEWKRRDNEIRQLQDRLNILKRDEELRQLGARKSSSAAQSSEPAAKEDATSTVPPVAESPNVPPKQSEKVEL